MVSSPTFQHCSVCGIESEFTEFAGRTHAQCTECGSLERHRKQALYLRRFTDLFSTDKPVSVLHIAPEPCFYQILQGKSNINYVPADLDPRKRGANSERPITPANLCYLPFADRSFDVIICSHVLEHVPTDDDAMDEIHRVLADDGFAILDVPLRHAATTYEDWSITSDEGRTQAFGQYDHVRFYGRDYFDKLAHAGLDAEEVDNFWDDNEGENAQLGTWGIIVARRGQPTSPSDRPPHNRPLEGASDDAGEIVPTEESTVAASLDEHTSGQEFERAARRSEIDPSDFWSSFSREEGGEFRIDGTSSLLSPDVAFRNASLLPGTEDGLVIEGADTVNGHSVALAIAAARAGSILIESSDTDGSTIARVRFAEEVTEPEPMSEPPRPQRMNPALPVERPPHLANDYLQLVKDARRSPTPDKQISVVIPVYNRKRMLRRTLASLAHQTYPLEHIEIVIADDGSSDNPRSLVDEFDGVFGAIRYVRQEDQGYRLSEVRNLGLRSASHEFMILLDCDMAPVPRLVELYARHLAAEPNAVYCGHRRYVNANGVDPKSVLEGIEPMLALTDIRPDNVQVTTRGEEGPTVDWRLPIYQETDSLRFEKHPFRAVCGGNIAFTKSSFASIGEFDVDFRAWGGEDAEWGYRAWNRGLYVVPILDACGLHQEPPGGRNETDREAGRKETHPLLVDRCPVRFRRADDGANHSVPLVSIYIPAYNAESTIVSAISSALGQTVRDLEVCVVNDGSTDDTVDLVEQHFGHDPRVRLISQRNGGIGAASETAVRMCRAPFIGQLDADDLLKKNAVKRMLDVLRSDPRIGVAYSSSELMNAAGKRVGDSYEFPHFSRCDLMYGMIVHHFRLFRARDWYRTSGFAIDIANAVDYDMYLKMAEVTEIVHIPAQLYRYRKHPTSTSHARRAAQRANHRLVIGRAMDRRGLSDEWELTQNTPKDVRKYEFSPVDRAPRHYGPPLDTVRVRINAGPHTPVVLKDLKNRYPGWKSRRKLFKGKPHIVTRQVSHARAVSGIENLKRTFPEIEIEVVYS